MMPIPTITEEQFVCLREELTTAETVAFLKVAKNTSASNLRHAWNIYRFEPLSWRQRDFAGFAAIIEELIDNEDEVVLCDNCMEAAWYEDCREINDGWVCDTCFDRYYRQCVSCDDYTTDFRIVDDEYWCRTCVRDYLHYCEECDCWYSDDYIEDHEHGCDCEAPRPCFEFPADGHGTVKQNERLVVELAKGTISEVGMQQISNYVNSQTRWEKLDKVERVLNEIGPEWQKKTGNFTKRLSGALYKAGIKLDKEVISEVGNIARANSSDEATWHIEFTRDLNLPAKDFFHSGSCWWGSLHASRCALKNWGGIGLRSFDPEFGNVTGRVWVQPMTYDNMSEEFKPTHDAINADAYIVYNGYGTMQGYTGARIVAHLTGRSYKKIEFVVEDVYVNAGGYLIASPELCENTDEIEWYFDVHSTFDAHQVSQRSVA